MNNLLKRYKELGHEFNPEEFTLKKSLRVNTLKISESDLVKRLKSRGVKLTKIDFLNNAYYFESDFPLVSSEEYLLGYFYFQEAASLIPANELLSNVLSSPTTDSRTISVLDMCAAPGSKTTQIAQILGDKGIVVALDDNLPRISAIKNNAERLGITSIIAYKKDARFADDINMKFDFVLLDAPCSGNFCVEPDFFNKRSVHDFENRAKIQRELLKAAYRVLSPGGTLVYSTCSLEPEEDEMVIDWFLERYDDVKLLPLDIKIGEEGKTNIFGQELKPEIKLTRKFWPHKTGTEGFFIAKLKKLKE